MHSYRTLSDVIAVMWKYDDDPNVTSYRDRMFGIMSAQKKKTMSITIPKLISSTGWKKVQTTTFQSSSVSKQLLLCYDTEVITTFLQHIHPFIPASSSRWTKNVYLSVLIQWYEVETNMSKSCLFCHHLHLFPLLFHPVCVGNEETFL